ncbi:MAG: fibronectin type III domain-containing protein [Verrucomicrobia bacterium]|nr:fibronectin type III domain-containing protein [Verrucomicrobiota bacterium]
MRIVRFDQGFKFDDPNIYFGATDDAPAYQLEPGDPGYKNTAPATGALQPHTRSKAMNETPENPKLLLALAKVMCSGATQLQDIIQLHHHRDTTLQPAILKLEGDPAAAPGSNANKGSQLVYKLCEDAAKNARSARKTLSDTTVKTLLEGYHDVIKRVHGRSHNTGWSAAGFTDGTSVPREHPKRQSLLATMRSYLAANPAHETTLPQPSGPALAVTAAAALALMPTFQAAFDLVAQLESDQENCKNLRDADLTALSDEVSGTTAELRQLLAADDPRWETFGLNIPAHPNVPLAVASATLTSLGEGREALSWLPAVRATYYRLFLKVHGVDDDFRFIKRDEDLDHTFTGLTPGSTISVQVIAANAGGEAAPSPTVTKVVGA